jgi:hypothetical protein
MMRCANSRRREAAVLHVPQMPNHSKESEFST